MKSATLEEFRIAITKSNGNISQAARTLGVTRQSVQYWIDHDVEYMNVLKDARKKIFDTCLSTAQVVAYGIPDRDESGNIVGWVKEPDAGMLKYLMTKLGRDEGFGDSIDMTTNGKDMVPSIEVQIVDKREDVVTND